MITDLEEATVDRHVVPIDIEHDDVAREMRRRGTCATPQGVRARRTDASPTLHLQTRWLTIRLALSMPLDYPHRQGTVVTGVTATGRRQGYPHF